MSFTLIYTYIHTYRHTYICVLGGVSYIVYGFAFTINRSRKGETDRQTERGGKLY